MFLSFRGQLDATSYEDSKSGLRIEIGKKRSKTGKIGYFASYRQFFFWPKKGQMLSDYNSETSFGILASRRI